MIYNEIDGLRYIMEKKEKGKTKEQFPTRNSRNVKSYAKIFFDIENIMNTEIHPYVTLGASSVGDGMLNDHGSGHVAMVAERAYMLLGEKAYELSGYEIFFLLLAIHFHDVGNILGRDEHEEKIDEVFDALGDVIPLDNVAKRLIREIAMSHGGKVDGNKDTISYVREVDYVDGLRIRASLLAAILRYADEIADDKNRASSLLLKLGTIPPKNKVFHMYSLSLEPPVVNGDTLILKYNIDEELVKNKVTKIDTEVYLYDEILLRLQKCLCELEYCRKYSQGFLRVSCISVTITIWNKKGLSTIYEDSFKLRLGGYPDISMYGPDKWCINSNIRVLSAVELINVIGGGKNNVK